MEKQTIQSGRGLECMKGIRKASVVFGTDRRPASNNWKSKPTILHSLRTEVPSMAVALWKHAGRVFYFRSPFQVFYFTLQLSPRHEGRATQYQGLHKSQLQEETPVQQILQSLRTEALWAIPSRAISRGFQFFRMTCMSFSILATFPTILYSLRPQKIKSDFHLFRSQVKSATVGK